MCVCWRHCLSWLIMSTTHCVVLILFLPEFSISFYLHISIGLRLWQNQRTKSLEIWSEAVFNMYPGPKGWILSLSSVFSEFLASIFLMWIAGRAKTYAVHLYIQRVHKTFDQSECCYIRTSFYYHNLSSVDIAPIRSPKDAKFLMLPAKTLSFNCIY